MKFSISKYQISRFRASKYRNSKYLRFETPHFETSRFKLSMARVPCFEISSWEYPTSKLYIKLLEKFLSFHKMIINVWNLEWPSVYGTDRPIPFFRKFRIMCPLRALNLIITPRSGENPGKGSAGRARWTDKTQRLVGRISNVRHRTSVRVKYFTLNKILSLPCS